MDEKKMRACSRWKESPWFWIELILLVEARLWQARGDIVPLAFDLCSWPFSTFQVSQAKPCRGQLISLLLSKWLLCEAFAKSGCFVLLNNQVIASRKIFQLLFSLSVKQIEVERLVDGCYLLLSVDIASRLEGECFFFFQNSEKRVEQSGTSEST